MLKKILSRDACAACRFCCSFRRQSLWETPLFEKEAAEKLREQYPEARFVEAAEPFGNAKTGRTFMKMDYTGLYQTEDPQEEVLCFFNRGGCILPPEDKPFECKIWPLRVMRKEGRLVIALSPACPVVSKVPPDKVRDLVRSEIGAAIWTHAADHPENIVDYLPGYPVIAEQGEAGASR